MTFCWIITRDNRYLNKSLCCTTLLMVKRWSPFPQLTVHKKLQMIVSKNEIKIWRSNDLDKLSVYEKNSRELLSAVKKVHVQHIVTKLVNKESCTGSANCVYIRPLVCNINRKSGSFCGVFYDSWYLGQFLNIRDPKYLQKPSVTHTNTLATILVTLPAE